MQLSAGVDSAESVAPQRRMRGLFQSLPYFLTAVVNLALALRFLVVALAIPETSANTFDHNAFGWEMGWTARSIALGHGFSSPFLPMTGPTALVPPVYPYIIATMFRLFGLYTPASAFAILGFNSVCSSLTCIPLFFLVRRTLNERVARLCAIGWAVYPFAIYFSADRVWDYALTSLLFTCCLMAAQMLHLYRGRAWLGFGAFYGFAILSNPSIVTLFPLLLLFPMYKTWLVSGPWRQRGLMAVLGLVVVCMPWAVRNHRAMHANVFLRDGFWIEFYAGNNGDTSESNAGWAHPASNPAEMQKYVQNGEIAYVAEKQALAIDFVSHHPGFFLVATVRRVVRFWTGYWSFSQQYLKYDPLDVPNVPFCLFLCWAMFRGVQRMWRKNRGGALPYLLAILVFPLPYYLTHSSMDYRQPLEPVILVLVVVGLVGADEMRPLGRSARRAQLRVATS